MSVPTTHTALEALAVSKRYRLGKVGLGTLSEDVGRAWSRLTGKRDEEGLQGHIWALSDVSITIQQGEVVGLIGKNGAGKSTFLKILSQVTAPTKGRVRARGRIASLLEVGTGMHPELTGRENIFLNGAILGMTRREIADRLDAIIDFSGCETFIDTPVKRYSSGMKVRLGFSVAAWLEPEILIVDEVLAVGDAAFQKKAITRMQEVSASGHRTVLFVSHNMTAVRSLCHRAVLLEGGGVAFDGGTDEAVAHYLGYRQQTDLLHRKWTLIEAPQAHGIRVLESSVSIPGAAGGIFTTDCPLEVSVLVQCDKPGQLVDCTLHILNAEGHLIAASSSLYFGESLAAKDANTPYAITCRIPSDFFNQATYRFSLLIILGRRQLALRLDDLFQVSFTTAPRPEDAWMGVPPSALLPAFEWKSQ